MFANIEKRQEHGRKRIEYESKGSNDLLVENRYFETDVIQTGSDMDRAIE